MRPTLMNKIAAESQAKALRKEKREAMKVMGITYETSRDGQQAVEEQFNEKFHHLGRWQKCNPCESSEPHIDNVCCVCGTKNKPLVLTVKVIGLEDGDLETALGVVKQQIANGFTSGQDKNNSGSYQFSIKA